MKRVFIISFARIGMACAALATAAATLAFAIAAPVFDLIAEAFPPDKATFDRSVDTVGTEVADQMSQTGKGVWAFVTDLFSVEGRSYNLQA